MATTGDPKTLIMRIQKRINGLTPEDPRMTAALHRIGLLISAKAKFNARRQGIVDTGRLINSLRYEIYKEGNEFGVKVGSFGVPYARLHEFGGPFTPAMRRAMFWSIKRRGGPERKSKGVIQGGRFRARPYLRPAVLESRMAILSALREALRSG